MALTENGGLSIADAMALKGGNNGDGFFGGDGSWIFFLFFLLAWGNGGWGNGFGGGGAAGGLSRAEMYDGFNMQDVKAGIAGLSNGLCDGFYAVNSSLLTGFGNVDKAMCTGFNGVTSSICDLGYALKDCCCQTQSAIQGVNYNMAKNTCDIMTANSMNTRDIIDSQNQGFQRIIDHLNDEKIDSLRTELQAAQLQLGNLSQTNTIINTLRPIPQPAYITYSPYASVNNGYGGCGSCCGCY